MNAFFLKIKTKTNFLKHPGMLAQPEQSLLSKQALLSPAGCCLNNTTIFPAIQRKGLGSHASGRILYLKEGSIKSAF